MRSRSRAYNYSQNVGFINLVDKVNFDKLATVKRLKADVSNVSPSSERIKELWIALGLYREWWSYAIGRNMAT